MDFAIKGLDEALQHFDSLNDLILEYPHSFILRLLAQIVSPLEIVNGIEHLMPWFHSRVLTLAPACQLVGLDVMRFQIFAKSIYVHVCVVYKIQ